MLWNGAMDNNRFIIAAAGAGKTTYIVRKACAQPDKKILITTYTTENYLGIKEKIIKEKGHIPKNITIQTWFSFLLQHGVRPYQDAIDATLHEVTVGFCRVEARSAKFIKESDVLGHYFTSDVRIYSDKISKFVFKSNEASKGAIISRIEKIYDDIYIDEVQDLSGYDLALLKLLFASKCNILIVGDPRQTTYTTHNEAKFKQYIGGKIKNFIENELGKKKSCEIDEETLSKSHRNHTLICKYSSMLYHDFLPVTSCDCCIKDGSGHEGVFLVKPIHVNAYLSLYSPVQLRWDIRTKCDKRYPAFNMGESKGLEFERVLIYPTGPIRNFIKNNKEVLLGTSLAKFYVAITRAFHSVAIIFDYKDTDNFEGIIKYSPRE